MPTYKLIELIDEVISGEWGQDVGEEKEGVKVIRTTNFSNTGKLDLNKEVVLRNIDKAKVEEKKLQSGDIIIEKSGGSPDQPVGRVVYFEEEELYLCNNFTSVLRPKKELVVPKYLMYVLYNLHRTKKVLKFQNKTTGIINLKLEQYLNQTRVIIPPLEIQNKVVRSLDQAYGLIEKRQSQITALDELTQSLFLEMFGNPLTNPKEYPLKQLGSLIEVKGGYAFKSKDFIDEGIPVVRIGTANKGYFDEKTLAFLPVIYQEKYEEYIVNRGDLLITLTGTVGKDDYGNICEVEGTFGRYLLNQRVAKLTPKHPLSKCYMYYCFKNKSFKEQLTKVSRGVRQANISNDDIKKLMIAVPPIEDQIKFEEIVNKIKESKMGILNSLIELGNLYNSLLQKAFKGELFPEQ